jgi:hypothetical protein
MRITLLTSLLAVMAAIAACAPGPEMVRERGVRLNEKGEKLYCERTRITGSHLPVERCLTETEMEAEREKAQRMVRDGKIGGAVNNR